MGVGTQTYIYMKKRSLNSFMEGLVCLGIDYYVMSGRIVSAVQRLLLYVYVVNYNNTISSSSPFDRRTERFMVYGTYHTYID